MLYDINFERDEIYECGALLLTVLATLNECSERRSFELYRSLCGKALKLMQLEKPDDWTPITVKPPYMRDCKTIDRDVAYVAKRLGERMARGGCRYPSFNRPRLPS